MINSEDAKDVIVKVIDTEPKNRTWVLSLVIIVILAGGNFFFYSRASKAEEKEAKAKVELEIQKAANLLDSKNCFTAIQEANKMKDLEWSAKFNKIQDIYNKDLRERADKLEKQIEILNKKLGR